MTTHGPIGDFVPLSGGTLSGAISTADPNQFIVATPSNWVPVSTQLCCCGVECHNCIAPRCGRAPGITNTNINAAPDHRDVLLSHIISAVQELDRKISAMTPREPPGDVKRPLDDSQRAFGDARQRDLEGRMDNLEKMVQEILGILKPTVEARKQAEEVLKSPYWDKFFVR